MSRLQLVDTSDDPQAARADTLNDYWRAKYDQLAADSTAQTIGSLRSQLRTIKRLAQEVEDDPQEALRAIVKHAAIGLEIDGAN